jgi:hypothetical protein
MANNFTIHELFMDGGKEFLRLENWAKEKGIIITNTPPNTLEPRGRIERAGGIITTMARSAIIDAKLPKSLWPYAEAWAVRVLNTLPATANQSNESPHSKFCRLSGIQITPSFSHIRIFGSIAWLLQKGKAAPPKGDKNEPRAIKGRYLGAASQRGHVVYVWIPSLHKIQTARDVTIVEKFDDDWQEEEPEWIAQWESEA